MGTVVGGVIGVILERTVGRVWDWHWGKMSRSRNEKKGRRVAESTRRNSELVAVADDLVYIHAFYASGLRLTSRLMAELRLEQRWQELPSEFGFEEGRLDQLEALRTEIDRDPSRWNEKRLGLSRVIHGRHAEMDIPTYELVFHPTDYAATRFSEEWWQAVMTRDDILALDRGDLADVFPGLSHSFGINATVVTEDGYLVLVHRSARISSARRLKHISVNEGMQIDDLNSTKSPDVEATIKRGLSEELGISDVPAESILIHSIILDATRYQWAVLGHVDLRGTGVTMAMIDGLRRSGMAADHWENDSFFPVPFNADAILEELRAPEQWIAHGWVNLLLTGVAAFPARSQEFLELMVDKGGIYGMECDS